MYETATEYVGKIHEFLDKHDIKTDIILLIIFIIFGYFLRKAFFIGMAMGDDYDYTQLAVMITEGRFNPLKMGYNFYPWRFPMIYPLALCFKIFGSTGETAAAFWPLLSSLLGAAVLYLIGLKLFDSKIGLIAALIHLLYPTDVFYSTCVLTETPFNLFILTSVLFFVYGELTEKLWKKHIFFFLSGFFLMWLLYGRPYGVFVLFAYAAFMVLRYRINFHYLMIPAGFLISFIGFELYLYNTLGVIFENLRIMKIMVDPLVYTVDNLSQHLDFYRNTMFNNRLHHPHFYIFLMSIVLLFLWNNNRNMKKGEILTLETAARKRHHGIFIIFWLGSILLYIEFGVMDFERMIWFHKLDRYLTIVSAPICLGGAVFLGRFTNRFALIITAVMLIAITVWWTTSIMPPQMIHFLGIP